MSRMNLALFWNDLTSTVQKKIKLAQEAMSIHYETKSENYDDDQCVQNMLQKVGGAKIASVTCGAIEVSKQYPYMLLDGCIVTIVSLAATKLKPMLCHHAHS